MAEPVAGLQFETAETSAGSGSDVRCASCGDTLGSYFEMNGAVACRRCKDRAVAAASASHVPTLLRATGLGLGAAAAGSALYYGVAALTGYELGLISIVVGLLVGLAVRKGSRARGGWRYQALAIFLTYLAIASTYVPRVFEAMRAEEARNATAQAAGAPVAPANAAAVETASSEDAAAPAPPPGDVGFVDVVVAVGMLLAFVLALPFLAGFENFMGLVIIAIGLYEAWKVNRIPALSVTGPYQVGASRPASA